MMQTLKYRLKSRSLLWKCLATSVALHGAFLYFFSKHPLHISCPTFFSKSKPHPKAIAYDPETNLQEKNEILEEVFDQLVLKPSELSEPYDLLSLKGSLAIAPDFEEFQALTPLDSDIKSVDLNTKEEELLTSEYSSIEDLPLEYEMSLPDSLSLSSNSQEDFDAATAYISPIDTSFADGIGNSQEDSENENISLDTNSIYEPIAELFTGKALEDALTSQAPYVPSLKMHPQSMQFSSSASSLAKQDITKQSIASSREIAGPKRNLIIPYTSPELTDLDDHLAFQVANILEWNNDFDAFVKLTPMGDEEGYLFSVSLQPKVALQTEKMPQNFYFLIDKSSTLEKHRFSLFKRAVLKSLSSLSEGDRFNILILDKKIARLSPNPIAYNLKSASLAEEFLDKHNQSSIFRSSDLYGALESILAQIPENNEVNTAVLLTNGKTSQSYSTQQKAIKTILNKNSGKLSIYTAAVGQHNNLVQLDMLSSLTGGRLLYSDTNAAFPRKLAEMVKTLRAPLAKNLTVSIVPSHSKATFALYPLSSHLPTLYASEPYVILGTIDRLCDFTLAIQGKHDEEWVTINKTITFQNAKSDPSLRKEFKARQTAALYTEFLKEAKSKPLKEARELLQAAYGKVAAE